MKRIVTMSVSFLSAAYLGIGFKNIYEINNIKNDLHYLKYDVNHIKENTNDIKENNKIIANRLDNLFILLKKE